MKKNLLFSCALLFSAMAFAQTYKNVYSAKQDWSSIHDFFGMDDDVSHYSGLTLDDSGAIYITGSTTRDSLGNTIGFCNKYGTNGNLEWFSASTHGDMTSSNGIIWDSEQNRIYNCGSYYTTYGGVGLAGAFVLDMFQANDSFLGEYFWPDPNATKRLPNYAGAYNLCEDKKGKIYVTGFIGGYLSYGVLNHNMLTTFKMDGADTLNGIIWQSTYDSTNLLEEEGQFIAVDPNNNAYVAGIRGDTLPNNINFSLLCVKYDSSGNIKWQRKYQNIDTFHLTNSTGLAVSNSGSAYMSGNLPDPGAYHNDGIILKYTNQGKLAWEKRMSSLMLHVQDAGCNGLSLDKSGNLFAAGYIETDSGAYATLVKFDTSGNVLWMDTLHDEASNGALISNAIALTLDDTGNVYVTGTRGDNHTFQDIFTARYNSAGDKQWYIRYNDSILTYNSPTAIKLDKKGNVIVAGGHNGDTISGEDILVLKYSQSMAKVRVHNSAVNASLEQSSNVNLYPNPFSDKLNCELTLSEASSVYMTFYDLTGRELKARSYPDLQVGQNNFEIGLDNLSKGLYFYKCTIVNQDGANTLNGKVEKL